MTPWSPLLELSPDAVIVVDATWSVADANDHAGRLFRAGAPGLVGVPLDALLPPSVRPLHHAHVRGYATHPRKRSMGASGQPLHARRQDGSIFPVDIALAPLDWQGRTYTIAVVRDRTDATRHAEHRSETRRMDAALAAGAGFAHDVRNPLMAATNHLELAEEALARGDAAEAAALVALARESTGHIAALVEGYLGAGRASAAEAAAPVDLGAVVAAATRLARRAAGELEVELEADVQVVGSFSRWVLLVVNLVDNAHRALYEKTPAGTRVKIGLRRCGDEALLVVDDDGRGIPASDLERVFTPFFSTHHGRGGTGLGLSGSRSDLERVGGRIDLQSVDGEGTRVEVRLPLA